MKNSPQQSIGFLSLCEAILVPGGRLAKRWEVGDGSPATDCGECPSNGGLQWVILV